MEKDEHPDRFISAASRTLGFLAGNLHMGMAPRLWSGMIAAAHQYDVNLFCFPGGSVHPVGEFNPNRSRKTD